MPIFTYLEDVDSVGPGSAGFSWTNARATSRYQLTYDYGNDLMSQNDLAIAVTDILGDTTSLQSNYALKRQLPLAHPVYPWLYASEINEIKGIGTNRRINSASQLEAPTISPEFYRYAKYYLTITFAPRPYAVIGDGSISTITTTTLGPGASYYNFAGTGKEITFAEEWLRYCDWEPVSQPDSVTATQGQMYFRDSALLIVNPIVGAVGAQYPTYNGMPRMFLNNQMIKFFWYQVPFSYISSANSYIQAFRGRINQLPWFLWDAGELLYLDFKIHRYTPPVQALVQQGNVFLEGGKKTFSTAKFVDIEFQLLDCVRKTNDLYSPKNKNWLVKGHNLLPYWRETMGFFHYATTFNFNTPADETKWSPSWLSVPFELLFTNPDAVQAGAPLGFLN